MISRRAWMTSRTKSLGNPNSRREYPKVLVETLLAASLSFESPALKSMRNYFPPMRYDYPFPGRLIVQWMEPTEVIRYCPQMGIACVIEIRPGDYCLIAA